MHRALGVHAARRIGDAPEDLLHPDQLFVFSRAAHPADQSLELPRRQVGVVLGRADRGARDRHRDALPFRRVGHPELGIAHRRDVEQVRAVAQRADFAEQGHRRGGIAVVILRERRGETLAEAEHHRRAARLVTEERIVLAFHQVAVGRAALFVDVLQHVAQSAAGQAGAAGHQRENDRAQSAAETLVQQGEVHRVSFRHRTGAIVAADQDRAAGLQLLDVVKGRAHLRGGPERQFQRPDQGQHHAQQHDRINHPAVEAENDPAELAHHSPPPM